MGETISDMEIELEQNYNKRQFLGDKIGTPLSKIVE